MKEGSIGTRNCTVNTEKNVVARTAADEGDERVKKESEQATSQKKKEQIERKTERERE